MRRILSGIVCLILSHVLLQAGTNGSISGTVKDKEGKALQGATVKVVGTNRGGFVKASGSFLVINIPAGSYDVKISMLGYKERTRKVTVSADQTTDMGSIVLESSAVTTKEAIVTAERIVDDKKVGAKTEVSNADIVRTAGKENAQQIVLTQSGVLATGGGLSVRGGRQGDSRILIDGQDVSDAVTGGFGAAAAATGDVRFAPTTSNVATEGVQLIKGNASSEYGNATGGFLNQTVKQGRTDKYEGVLRWKTDVPALWGTAGNGAKAMGSFENSIDFGIGGPLPFLDGSTFYLSTKYFTEKFRVVNSTNYLGYAAYGESSGLDIKDPAGNSLGHLPYTGDEVRNITGRIPFKITDDIKFILGGTWGLTTLESNSWGELYAKTPAMGYTKNASTGVNDTTVYSMVPTGLAHSNVLNNFIYSYYARLNHIVTNSTFYEATISYNNNITESGRRKFDLGSGSLVKNGVIQDPGMVSSALPKANFFEGFKLIDPQDNYSLSGDTLDKVTIKGNKSLDHYEPTSGTVYLDNDRNRPAKKLTPSNLTRYIEGNVDYTGTDNPYGIAGAFTSEGNNDAPSYRISSFVQFTGNVQSIMEAGAVKHTFKAGTDLRLYTIRRYINQNPYTGNPFYDVYDDRFGGDIYSLTEEDRKAGSQPIKSRVFSGYLEDQISYKGINLNPALRIDMFDPNISYKTDPTLYNSSNTAATFKVQVNPRIYISYPISERAFFSIAYGIFTQVPTFNSLYDNVISTVNRGNTIVSNPDLQNERTNQYNIGYTTQFGDDLALEVNAYYKDIYSQIGLVYVPDNRNPYTLKKNSEYGNVKGVEVILRKKLSNNFVFDINYTGQSAQGTSSAVGSNYNLLIGASDPFSGKKVIPLVESPLDFDRPHRINANFGIVWGSDEGPALGGIKFLQNTTINFTGLFQSGQPYTLLNAKSGAQAGDYNAERQPSLWNLDLRLQRTIYLKGLFGDSFGTSALELFADFVNLLDRTQPVSVYARTRSADNDGTSALRNVGDFVGPWFAVADPNNSNSIDESQYDNFGRRKYNVVADLNRDGIVTQTEQLIRYRGDDGNQTYNVSSFIGDRNARRPNYQFPRQVYFGVIIRF